MSQHQKNDANVSMKILLLKILGSRCSGTSELNVINESYSGLKNAPSAAISLVLFGLMFHHFSPWHRGTFLIAFSRDGPRCRRGVGATGGGGLVRLAVEILGA